MEKTLQKPRYSKHYEQVKFIREEIRKGLGRVAIFKRGEATFYTVLESERQHILKIREQQRSREHYRNSARLIEAIFREKAPRHRGLRAGINYADYVV